MIARFLVKDGFTGNIKFVESWDEVIHTIKTLTFAWCDSPNYRGGSWNELFEECLENKDFDDIANVFEIQGNSIDVLFPKTGDTIKIKRIL